MGVFKTKQWGNDVPVETQMSGKILVQRVGARGFQVARAVCAEVRQQKRTRPKGPKAQCS